MKALQSLLLFSSFALSFSLGDDQSVAVAGQVFCDGFYAKNVLVELMERDRTDPDDSMADAHYTNQNGIFQIDGWQDEFTEIEPYLRITHFCRSDHLHGCARVMEINIPPQAISKGRIPMKLFQLKPIDLTVQWENESVDCSKGK